MPGCSQLRLLQSQTRSTTSRWMMLHAGNDQAGHISKTAVTSRTTSRTESSPLRSWRSAMNRKNQPGPPDRGSAHMNVVVVGSSADASGLVD